MSGGERYSGSGRAVTIVRTGAANLASVEAALRRLGVEPVLSERATDIDSAERLVLPGVGSFGAAMQRMNELGIVDALRARIVAGKPTMAICLGMQLLMEESEESPGVRGLGIVPGRVARFVGDVRVPHFGWNAVTRANVDAGVAAIGPVEHGMAYFANSYRITAVPSGWGGAWTEYAGSFVSTIWNGRVLACQFHPELSGSWGADLIRRWLDGESAERSGDPRAGGSRRSALKVEDFVGGVRRRVIPCLDVRDGRVVKGIKFQNLRDAGDPAELAAAYEAQGADELTVLDVSATPEGRQTAVETVKRVRKVLSIPLTVGGGVRAVADAQRLLEAGADKVGVNSAAVRDPALLTRLAEQFGRQCVVLALDAAKRMSPLAGPAADLSAGQSEWEVVVESGKTRTGIDAVEWAKEAERRGAGEILLTSWDRDGTRSGYDLAQMRAISGAVRVPVIASGGVAGAGHLVEAIEAGADAVLAASIFHDGEQTVADVKREMAGAGVAVRQ